MKKIIIVSGFLLICACASQPIKTEALQARLGIGMSTPDVIALLGIPDEKKQDQLVYPGAVINFKDEKLVSAKVLSNKEYTDLQLKPVEADYKPDAVVLNKDKNSDLEATAYKVAGYLHSESLFERAVQAGVKVDGFTISTNALCVALSEGFLKGTEDVVRAGFNDSISLRTDKGIYIFPEDCLGLQKDPVVAEQLKQHLNNAKKAVADLEKEKPAGEKKEKSLIDWEAFKEFMKPQVPSTTK